MSEPIEGRVLQVHAGHHQIFVTPFGSQPMYGEHAGGVLLGVAPDARALIIMTGCADGPVSIELRNLDEEPSSPPGSFEVQESVSLIIDEALSLFGPTAESAGAWNVLEPCIPGPHRVRISGTGRGVAPDFTVSTPSENYLIEIWPEPRLRELETSLDDGRGLK